MRSKALTSVLDYDGIDGAELGRVQAGCMHVIRYEIDYKGGKFAFHCNRVRAELDAQFAADAFCRVNFCLHNFVL